MNKTLKEPQVSGELKMLEMQVQVLKENLNKLFERLKPIINEDSKDILSEEEPGDFCELAATIKIQRKKIEELTYFVENVCANLEI